jgi:hypothetical protein
LKNENKVAKREEDEKGDEREDDSLYISGVGSGIGSGIASGILSDDGVLSGDDGFDGFDEEASIRSLTLAEELLYAFQVYTTGAPTKK